MTHVPVEVVKSTKIVVVEKLSYSIDLQLVRSCKSIFI